MEYGKRPAPTSSRQSCLSTSKTELALKKSGKAHSQTSRQAQRSCAVSLEAPVLALAG